MNESIPSVIDEFQAVLDRVAAQLAEAPAQVEVLQTPMQRALDVLAPHLTNQPLYDPHA